MVNDTIYSLETNEFINQVKDEYKSIPSPLYELVNYATLESILDGTIFFLFSNIQIIEQLYALYASTGLLTEDFPIEELEELMEEARSIVSSSSRFTTVNDLLNTVNPSPEIVVDQNLVREKVYNLIKNVYETVPRPDGFVY